MPICTHLLQVIVKTHKTLEILQRSNYQQSWTQAETVEKDISTSKATKTASIFSKVKLDSLILRNPSFVK